jgi:hypothetical protein
VMEALNIRKQTMNDRYLGMPVHVGVWRRGTSFFQLQICETTMVRTRPGRTKMSTGRKIISKRGIGAM